VERGDVLLKLEDPLYVMSCTPQMNQEIRTHSYHPRIRTHLHHTRHPFVSKSPPVDALWFAFLLPRLVYI